MAPVTAVVLRAVDLRNLVSNLLAALLLERLAAGGRRNGSIEFAD